MKVCEQVVAQPGSKPAAQVGDHASHVTRNATARLHMTFLRIIMSDVDLIQTRTEVEDGFASIRMWS